MEETKWGFVRGVIASGMGVFLVFIVYDIRNPSPEPVKPCSCNLTERIEDIEEHNREQNGIMRDMTENMESMAELWEYHERVLNQSGGKGI